MKLSESWLREWVNPKISREQLCADLTMVGFEVEECVPAADSNDYIIDIAINPNRGDCLSVRGIAREVSAFSNTPIILPSFTAVPPTCNDVLPIQVNANSACPRYVGRVIRQVKTDASTPDWMRQRLLAGGIKTISPIVDVTNYVMLELGQPMHAFDLAKIQKGINVRFSNQGEKITLLDDSEIELDADSLVIADHEKPIAMAGVMGGLDSCVTSSTHDVLLESAYFSPKVIGRQRQFYHLTSDSAYRFERGVDSCMQQQAIERATQLILQIAGGSAGPLIEINRTSDLPATINIKLNEELIQQVLGVAIPRAEVESILTALNFSFVSLSNAWSVVVPSYRFDVTLPEDLIEEIARLYGYDRIPTHPLQATLQIHQPTSGAPDLRPLRQALCSQGYQEIISYSFVDKAMQALLDPGVPSIELLNPITADMNVMRTNLWPGLLNAYLYNNSRQQDRVRLFEVGVCFITGGNEIQQSAKVGGLIAGSLVAEQWAVKPSSVDFYDIKATVENILRHAFPAGEFEFKPEAHAALHPGQSATVYRDGEKVGFLGALHPGILQSLGCSGPIFLFELDLPGRLEAKNRVLQDISRFPEIRRDLAILLKQTVPAKDIQDTIKGVAGDWLKDVFIFDVYQGKGVSPGLKSIAVALILQHQTRTLVDAEVTTLMENVMAALKGQLGAELRS